MVFTLGELLNPMTQANQLKHHQESNPDNAELLLVYEAPAAAGTAAAAAAAVGSSRRNSLTCRTHLCPLRGLGGDSGQWTLVRRNIPSTGGPLAEKNHHSSTCTRNRFEQRTTDVNAAQTGSAVPHLGAVLDSNELHVTPLRNSITI